MKVASFYRFLELESPRNFRDALQSICEQRKLLGTVLVASEGINGSLAGKQPALRDALAWIEDRLNLDHPIEARWSAVPRAPFRRLRIRLKSEIVALGRPDLRPDRRSGIHVSATQWNQLLDDPDALVIDTRNHYEYEVGTFPGSIDPQTDSFREFPQFAEDLATTCRDRRLAMFCTGGIRCEKTTALMLELGFENVYHLRGGILKYLEETPAGQNRWQGECFVFDTRVAVDRDLAEGGYIQCHACRLPLSTADVESPGYQEGISCPNCIDELDPDRAARLKERRRQVSLARERGDTHIGPKSTAIRGESRKGRKAQRSEP